MSETRAMTVRSVTAAFTHEIIEAAAAKAVEIDVPMVISIVDHDGTLKAFRRLDGAPLLSIEIAQNKAYTAAAFGMRTDAWHDFIKEDESLRPGIVRTNTLVTFGGGYSINLEGELIGGIGVGGGHYTHDMQVAAGALEAVGLPTGS